MKYLRFAFIVGLIASLIALAINTDIFFLRWLGFVIIIGSGIGAILVGAAIDREYRAADLKKATPVNSSAEPLEPSEKSEPTTAVENVANHASEYEQRRQVFEQTRLANETQEKQRELAARNKRIKGRYLDFRK